MASTTQASSSGKMMNAVRFHGQEDLRYEQVPEPECGKGQIKIKPAWCGICGSDLHEYLGGPSLCPTTPHPITGEKVPLTFGHEFSGTIEEIGEGISDTYSVGDRVCVQPIIYDGTCGSCEEGLPNCCDNNGFVGLSGEWTQRLIDKWEADRIQAGEVVYQSISWCQSTAWSRSPTTYLSM